MNKVAAVVVFYNPDDLVMGNINSYINQVDKLFVVDNSENINNNLAEKINLLDNAKYVYNKSNIGIAAALNIGARIALEEGFDYLLTMDQDSKATPGMVEKLTEIMISSDEIGIVAAEHINPDIRQKPGAGNAEEILFTMTSGNLVSLTAYEKTGGYLEKLFIDHVDHEYCLRLNKLGYKVIKASDAILYHKVGNASRKKFLNHYLYPTNHSPIRIYYRMRNRLYVDNLYKKLFPEYLREDRRNMKREFLEIILYDSNKLRKIKMMLKGYIDYRKKRFGKL
jgi:rhamnosyltransferase